MRSSTLPRHPASIPDSRPFMRRSVTAYSKSRRRKQSGDYSVAARRRLASCVDNTRRSPVIREACKHRLHLDVRDCSNVPRNDTWPQSRLGHASSIPYQRMRYSSLRIWLNVSPRATRIRTGTSSSTTFGRFDAWALFSMLRPRRIGGNWASIGRRLSLLRS